MDTVVSPVSHQHEIPIKNEPMDETYKNCLQDDGCENLVSVKLEPADTDGDPYFDCYYDPVSDLSTDQNFCLTSGFDYTSAWLTEAPELRKLLSEPVATNGGSSANAADTSVQWLNEYFSKPKLTPWEEQIQTSLNAENDKALAPSETNHSQTRKILTNDLMSHVRTNELLWRQMISPRKRTYEEMVSEAISQEFGPLCEKNTSNGQQQSDSGKENYEETEERIYPASVALKKLCTSESTIRSILSSPQATLEPSTPVSGTEQLASSVIRSLLTSELKPTTTTTTTTLSSPIGDVMRRLQTSTTLIASPTSKREATKKLAGKSSSPKAKPKLASQNGTSSEQSTIRSLLTAPLPPPKTPTTDKPVLLNLLTEMPTQELLKMKPATPPTVHATLARYRRRQFAVMTSQVMSKNLRHLLSRPLSKLIEFDSSDKFADLFHGASRLAHETNGIYCLPAQFLDNAALVNDMGEFHFEDYNPRSSPLTACFGDLFPCPECHRTFANSEELLDHSTSHDERTFMCAECGDEFGTQRALVNHVKKDHKLIVSLGAKSKPVTSNNKTALSKNATSSNRQNHTRHNSRSNDCGEFEKRDRISGASVPANEGNQGNHCAVKFEEHSSKSNFPSTRDVVVVKKERGESEDGLWLTDGGETFLVEKNEEYDSDS